MQKTAPRVLLALIVIVSSVIAVSLLTRGHLWWDDFASYIMQAQSLLDGTTQEFLRRNAFTIERSSYLQGPVAYPWGYPLLIAPVLAVFGVNTLALKFVNTIFFALFLVVFYQLCRRRVPPAWSLTLTAILAFNPPLLQAQDLLLSDVPFLFVSTLALWLVDKLDAAGETEPEDLRSDLWLAAAIGAVTFVAFELRTNGLMLLGALGAAQFTGQRGAIRRRWSVIALPYIVFIVLNGLHYLVLPGGQESHLAEYAGVTAELVWSNVLYYLSLPAGAFAGIPSGSVFYGLLALLFIVGVFTAPARNAAFLSYIALTLGLYISWPERQGLRFLYPILPVLLIVAAQGLQLVLGKLPVKNRRPAGYAAAGVAAILIALSFWVSAQLAWVNLQNGREINGPFDPVSQEMFEFVREQTPPDSVVIFFRPRALRLFTDRDSFLTTTCADFAQADFMVLHEKQGGLGQVAQPEACTNVSLELLFNNQRFSVFQISK